MFSAKTMLDRGGETDIKQASKNGIMKTAEPRFNSCKTVTATAPKVDLFYSLKRGAEHAGIRRSRSPKASGDIVASPSLPAVAARGCVIGAANRDRLYLSLRCHKKS